MAAVRSREKHSMVIQTISGSQANFLLIRKHWSRITKCGSTLITKKPSFTDKRMALHGVFKDGAYYCYCTYVLRISRYSDFLTSSPFEGGGEGLI